MGWLLAFIKQKTKKTRYSRSTNMTVADIAAAVGIPIEKSFDRIFRQYNDMTPTQYRLGLCPKTRNHPLCSDPQKSDKNLISQLTRIEGSSSNYV